MSRPSRRTVAIVGGGPAGALLARLLKLQGDHWDITVYERSASGATYGFGIGLGPKALEPLEQIDPATVAELRSAGLNHTSRQRIHLGGEEIGWEWGEWKTLSTARRTLLSILQRSALEVGVDFRFDQSVTYDDVAGADLVVATDGTNSSVRQHWAEALGSDISYGHAHFYWCAAPVELSGPVFAFTSNEHGSFATHSYPYNGNMSGFMFEADGATLRNAGLDGLAEGLKPGESDDVSREYLEAVFADHLNGAQIATSASRWSHFRVVHNAAWHVGNVVLVGDAAHTAHPSIGSGTRMAMEDAVVLSRALAQYDIPSALEVYEAERRPAVESLQDAAFASQRWWETFGRRLDLPLPILALHYVTRTGRYGIRRMSAHDPSLVDAARQTLPDGYRDSQAVLRSPLASNDVTLPTRVLADVDDRLYRVDLAETDPESPYADKLIESLKAGGIPKGSVVLLQAPERPQFREALAGTMLADRIRHELDFVVGLPARLGDPDALDAVETALLTRRIDVVENLG